MIPHALIAVALTATSPFVHFQSPSGNINCLGAGPGSFGPAVSCLVQKHSWPAALVKHKPASCDVDFDPYTIGLYTNHGKQSVDVGSCRGDIGPLCHYTDAKCFTLGYGHSATMGPIKCTSATTGVTCRFTTGRRVGFMIAREKYVLYR
jgi:hypothetical protein